MDREGFRHLIALSANLQIRHFMCQQRRNTRGFLGAGKERCALNLWLALFSISYCESDSAQLIEADDSIKQPLFAMSIKWDFTMRLDALHN
jgi:hypothetical protein